MNNSLNDQIWSVNPAIISAVGLSFTDLPGFRVLHVKLYHAANRLNGASALGRSAGFDRWLPVKRGFLPCSYLLLRHDVFIMAKTEVLAV